MTRGKGNGRNLKNKNGRSNMPNNARAYPYSKYDEMFDSVDRYGNRVDELGNGSQPHNSQKTCGSRPNDNGPWNGSQQHNSRNSGYKPNYYQQRVDGEFRQKKQKEQNPSKVIQENSSNKQQTNDGAYNKSNSDTQMALQWERQRHSGKGTESAKTPESTPVCTRCFNKYDDKKRIPRCLSCGHTFCTVCLLEIIDSMNSKPKCYECKLVIRNVKKVDDVTVNYAVLDVVKVISEERPEHKSAESMSCRPKSDEGRPVVTPSSSQSAKKNSSSGSEQKMDWTLTERSPHNSRCLEIGICPSSFCSKCQKWVCDKCAAFDHDHRKGCYLILKKEALSQMRQAQLNGAKGAAETVENALLEWKRYGECLDAFSFAMQTAFETIAKEKERVKAMTEEGIKKKKKLDDVVATLPDAKTLPDALAGIQDVEDNCTGTQVWLTENLTKTFDLGRLNKVIKEILLSSIHMQGVAGNESNASPLLFAQHSLSGVTYMSQITLDGGRILIHSLTRRPIVIKGSRAMPLTSILSCLDLYSTLTFLDVGWEGEVKGRLYIRLLGDTQRGRQFVALCTGKMGPSLCGTRFHRVWWRDLPGEHLWGGDYNKGDGSGGACVLQLPDKEISSLPTGRCLPVTAGLVAGRYEKTGLSSIFRIYTRDCKKEDNTISYLSRSPAEVKDEEAFGRVEYGLDVLQGAVKLSNINDVTILNCGVVVET